MHGGMLFMFPVPYPSAGEAAISECFHHDLVVMVEGNNHGTPGADEGAAEGEAAMTEAGPGSGPDDGARDSAHTGDDLDRDLGGDEWGGAAEQGDEGGGWFDGLDDLWDSD